MTQQHGRIAALGLACFGPLQLRRNAPDFGCLQSTPKPGWSNADVVSPLEDALDLPVVLDTDVGAAADAEWRLGRGRGLAFTGVCHRWHRHWRRSGAGEQRRPATDACRRWVICRCAGIHATNFAGCVPFPRRLPGRAGLRPRHPRALGLRSVHVAALDHPGRSIIAGYLGQLASSIALLHAVDRIVFGGGVMADGSLLPLVRRAAHEYLNGYLQPLRDLEQVETWLASPALGDDAAIAGAMLQALHLLAT